MFKQQSYESVTTMSFGDSFGEVKTELKPSPEFQDQQLACSAMLVTAHTDLTAWVIDNTIDPQAQNGRQEQIQAPIKDSGREIARIIVSVPTTDNFGKAMFERLLEQSIVPLVERTARSYPSTRPGLQPSQVSGGSPLSQHLSSTLEETRQVSPRQLQSQSR
jgi:hypothetical protein